MSKVYSHAGMIRISCPGSIGSTPGVLLHALRMYISVLLLFRIRLLAQHYRNRQQVGTGSRITLPGVAPAQFSFAIGIFFGLSIYFISSSRGLLSSANVNTA